MDNRHTGRLIIVSNRLPFQLVTHEHKLEIRESDGGLVSALRSCFEGPSNASAAVEWIGSAEFSEKSWQQYKKQETLDLAYEVSPIFLDQKTYNKYYNGFCNATLWPLFHYFPSFVEFDQDTFAKYEEVNRIFADKIVATLQKDDVLWIHDYQLMLVAGMVRQQRPDVTIGFFLHIPFPSFELFRMLHRSWKEKIVDGLLGADLIGFHTHEYVQHFLKTVQMVKGYDHKFRQILLPDRVVKAEMFPLGIDFDKFHQATELPEVIEQRNEIKKGFGDKKIIFSVDRLDYTKGITHRLAGFEHFLKQHPEWHEQVVFVLVVVPSRQIILKYNERKRMIEEEIGRINGRYSTLTWQPVIYRYSQLSFHELVAMYHVADIGLITPLRDGMNLVAKEYIASRKAEGVLILSELAGAASELGEALLVNPMDPDDVSRAILEALNMPAGVQREKLELQQARLKEYSVTHWINDFLKQLSETKAYQALQEAKHVSHAVESAIISRFTHAKKRLLLLDYDGTLVPFSKHPKLAVPDEGLIKTLTRLANDPDTDVTVISGRDRDSLNSWFGSLPIHLICEHGAEMKLKQEDWKYAVDLDHSWKSVFRPVLETYTQRSPGSFIEDKKHTLVWHYRNVETGLGFTRSRELLDNLHHFIRNTGLNIIDGNRVIEIRKIGIDKGTVARQLVERYPYDFVLAIGDDKTDEDMFLQLHEDAFTVKIGPGQTAARYFITRQAEVTHLLEKMVAALPQKVVH
jgi:trehalose 6-phosphate synthase/phosphatase